ncbi:hypothetical protein Patl1_18182 [Pistacia atlantica]|uniref:Uncharacterized protein n=1 Tax=Pistacia atlantica TaxID=434234 RepID=A0ACC1C225_9ROSI|nr:hypothetical protein Patl1_18182 [Pistacia atlantica]
MGDLTTLMHQFKPREDFWRVDKLYDEEIQEHIDPKRPKSKLEDLVDDIFIAATYTSSATSVWTMTELMRNPWAMRRVQNEIKEIVKGKAKVEEGDFSKLMYLKLIVKEPLRLLW